MSLRAYAFWALVTAIPCVCQEGNFGVDLPTTLSAGGLYSHLWQQNTPTAGPLEGGGQAMLYPSLRLGENWYAYGALDLNLSPYYAFQASSPTNRVRFLVLQSFLAYTRSAGSKSLTIKAGQLSSAFGSFPLRYDDMQNPLLDAPTTYGSPSYGSYPVTLYGLPGVEVDGSAGRVDGRLQLTNSSPANPQNLLSSHQYANWTAGGGYTILQGFRVGASYSRGPYLQIGRFLAPTDNASQWPFSAAGVDAQWARGRWSLSGEWQRFYYFYPRYTVSPAVHYGYVEAKVVLNPRTYLAGRWGRKEIGLIQRFGMPAPVSIASPMNVTEVVVGYRPNHLQLIKIGYEWVQKSGTGERDNIAGVQLVTSLDAVNKVFR